MKTLSVSLVALALSFGISQAQTADHMPVLTSMFKDAAQLAAELGTCRFIESNSIVPEKRLSDLQTRLAGAKLNANQTQTLLQMLRDVKPVIADNRPLLEAILFCDTRPKDRKIDYDRFFDLPERVTAAIAETPGKDDAQVLELMQNIKSDSAASGACIRLDNGPFPLRRGIEASSKMGEALARFDISPSMRAEIEREYARPLDISKFISFGDLRAFCKTRGEELKKLFGAGKPLPPSAVDRLKALKPF